jgi:hypothetical protein
MFLWRMEVEFIMLFKAVWSRSYHMDDTIGARGASEVWLSMWSSPE